MKKIEMFMKKFKKFLNDNFETCPYKYYKPSSPKGYEERENTFFINTKFGWVFVRLDINDYARPYTFTIFTQMRAYEMVDNENKLFRFFEKGKHTEKYNFHGIKNIDEAMRLILNKYK